MNMIILIGKIVQNLKSLEWKWKRVAVEQEQDPLYAKKNNEKENWNTHNMSILISKFISPSPFALVFTHPFSTSVSLCEPWI